MIFSSQHLLPQFSSFPVAPAELSILHNAAQFKAELLRQISQARQRIYLCCLYLQHDEAGAEIMTALSDAQKNRPALDIRVLVDWHRAQRGLIGEDRQKGMLAGNARWYQELALQQTQNTLKNIPVYGVPVQTRELFGVLHLKGFIIDDCVIYSGASINNVYLHQIEKYRHDRYLLVRNKALADCMLQLIKENILSASAVHRLDAPGLPATRLIAKDIRRFRDQLKRARYPLNHQTLASKNQQASSVSITPVVGVGKNNPLNRVICKLISTSLNHLTICTPYFNFPPVLSKEIERALQRGVRVEIIVGDKTANDFFIRADQPFKIISVLPYLYETNLRRFVKKHQKSVQSGRLNVHLWKDGEHSFHLKGLWSDQQYSLMTGNNFNPRAFRLDLENALLIHDPKQELRQSWTQELESILQQTTRVKSYQDIEKLPDYPEKIKKLMIRLSRSNLDRLAYRVL